MKVFAFGLLAYSGAVSVLIPLLYLPLVPGTVEFFAAHSVAWGLACMLVIFQRKHAWESAGLTQGPAGALWTDPIPAWAYDGAFVTHALLDLPQALLMTLKVCASMDALREAATLTLDDMPADVRYGPSLALEHCIFASHFGYFLADFVVHIKNPQAMYIVHHLVSMVLLFGGSLVGSIPGVIALAFCTPVLEIGSMSYIAYVLWKTKGTYILLMNLSNLVYFVIMMFILAYGRSTGPFFYSLVSLGICLVLGRSAFLVSQLKVQPKEA